MGNMEKIINHKYAPIAVTVMAFITYICSTYANVVGSYILYTIYGIIMLLTLIFSKETYLSLLMLLYIPFTIGQVRFHEGTYVQLYSWFVPVIFIGIGIFINYKLYKPKLRLNKWSIGLMIYCLGLGLGGIASQLTDAYTVYYYKWYFTPLILLGLAIVNFVIIYFTSTTKKSFEDFIDSSMLLTVLIIFEILFFMISRHISPIQMIREKALDLGWGIHNAVAMIFLTAMPLCIYRAFTNIKKNWPYLIYYFVLFGLQLFIVCKGGILAAFIGSIVGFIGLMVYFKQYRKTLLSILISFVVICVVGFTIIMVSGSPLGKMFNFNTLKSRVAIWNSAFQIFRANPIFGIGLMGPAGWNVSLTFPHYQFAHNTLIEILAIGGVFGTICFIYHLVEKYARLFYKMDFKKFIFFLFFLYPALYGLIDNSYLEITYMFYFIFGLIIFDNEIKDEEINWLLHFKKKDLVETAENLNN